MADPNSPLSAARHARQLYLRHLVASLDGFAQKLIQQLSEPADSTGGTPTGSATSGSHDFDPPAGRIDVLMQLRQLAPDWVAQARSALETLGRKTGSAGAANVRLGVSAPSSAELSLMTDEMVEARILAARMALVVADKGSGEFNDLRLRLQHLEKTDLDEEDPVRAGVFVHLLVQSWLDAGLKQEHWQFCQSMVIAGLIPMVVEGWHDANSYLLEQGVLPHIDLRQLVRRTGSSQPAALPKSAGSGGPAGPSGPAKAASPALGALTSAAAASVEVANRLMRFLQDNLPAGARRVGAAAAQAAPAGSTAGRVTGANPATGAVPNPPGSFSASAAATDNGAFPPTEIWNLPNIAVDWSSLASSTQGVRQQVRALKAASSNDHDKAVIEVVALIFENILAEERIPPSIRVWFARLQMPVLRTAVIDPEFLSSPEHPARLLIDRMGSCVLGFDSAVSLEPLEQEIRRIVQVIEQYPETGRRVFELMHQEFNDFLTKHLHTDDHVGKVVNLAKQVEQKETLTVKYTIELRKLLSEVAVRDEVRDFLFQVWVEVLAFATVKYGAQHEKSLALRNVASELLWAASAKPSRGERAKVIARLPGLLGQLREGMQLLGFDASRQEAQIQSLSDALTDAFMSRTQPIDSAWLNGLTQALAGLEDYLGDLETGYHSDADEHFELSADSIEMITGVDASAITVLPDTPQSREAITPEALVSLRTLPLGAWFDLEHNGQRSMVQLVWRSGRHQMFLLARPPEQSFLMQAGRLAHYLQVGLLRSCEAEPLTTRATRDALDKLSANPERLLA